MSGNDYVRKIGGPPVIAIGWIPRRLDLPESLTFDLTEGRLWASMHAVYLLGNDPPPDNIFDISALKAILAKRDFRAALWLFNVNLTVDGDDRAINVDCDDDHNVGFTPYFSFVPGSSVRQRLLKTKRFNSPGEGDGQLQRTTNGNCGILTRTVWFRLGKGANCISRIMSGGWAPYAWMKVVYKICSDGSGSVEFHGSCIPSQNLYIQSKKKVFHDMTLNDTTQTKSFLSAGDGQNAPPRLNPITIKF